MLVARTLLKEIKAGEFSLAAAARIPILSPSATLATLRAYAAETDVALLCGREATSAEHLTCKPAGPCARRFLATALDEIIVSWARGLGARQ